jgi:glycosyltransferase involved in cell wall biosynthesis
MKVLHTITKLELGGAQQNTLYTLSNMPDAYNGYLICGRGGALDNEAIGSTRYKTRFCPFLIREINPLFDFLAFAWMFFYFLGNKPDIIHTHSSKAGILSRWAAKLAGVKRIIHTFHGFGFTPLQHPFIRKLFIFLEKITAGITDKLIAVAEANVDTALVSGIGRREQYLVIRSGVDVSSFKNNKEFAKIRDELGLSADTKLIGNVSCFKPQKGLHDFIKACSILRARKDYHFVLVGDGVLREELQKQSFEAGLQDRLHMLGWRRDVRKILPEFDMILHTAYFEGLPRVFLESMASGVPIVATEVDGATDVIEDGVNGYLVETGDINSMVKYTDLILSDETLRLRMAEEGRKRLGSQFDIKIMSDKLNEIYAEMMKG